MKCELTQTGPALQSEFGTVVNSTGS